MKTIANGSTILSLAALCLACSKPPEDAVNRPSLRQASVSQVARGEQLSAMLGCRFCHMAMGDAGPDFARPFAGGFEVHESFGTWRAPNITQDPRTGIGSWTDAAIVAAIREGVRPDGTRLYPVMPYASYNRMTDEDAHALVAFLRTVPAIDHAVEPNAELALPRPVVAKPPNVPDPVADPTRHGEYLVTIMACTMCHTPSGPDGLPDPRKPFAGGVAIELPMLGTGTLYASNITSDRSTGIGAWSRAELDDAVRTPGVGGARIQAYLTHWNGMSASDLAAIVAYLATIPPIENAVPRSTFTPGVADRGRPITARRGR